MRDPEGIDWEVSSGEESENERLDEASEDDVRVSGEESW